MDAVRSGTTSGCRIHPISISKHICNM